MTAHILCLGIAVQDTVFSVAEMPRQAVKYQAGDYAVVGGGCAANAAVAVVRLGGRASLATRLGADATGAAIVAELEGEGVDCTYAARIAGHRSPVSAVLVDAAGERLIVNYRDPDLLSGASGLPDPAELGIAAVLADTRWPAAAADILAAARASGLPAVVDAEPPLTMAEAVLHAATHIAFSRDGLAEWAGTDDLDGGLNAMQALAPAFVCVTDGAGGVHYRHGAVQGHVPAYPVDVVDTLGAGDIWHGAFALALGEGRGDVPALKFASATAALKCRAPGARDAIPSRGEVEAFMMEQAA